LATKVADITVSDDLTGTNILSLGGADAGLFEIVGMELRLIAVQHSTLRPTRIWMSPSESTMPPCRAHPRIRMR